MPVHCAAIGCRNTIDVKRKPAAQIELEKIMKVTFHTFPSDPVRKAEWIRILGLENKNINNRSRLCSLHFKEEYIDRTSLVYVRLKENAVPHIFEDVYDEMDPNDTVSVLPEFLNTQVKIESGFEKHSATLSVLPEFLNTQVKIENGFEKHSATFSKCDKGTNTSLSIVQKSTQDKETRISPERIWIMNASNMEALRKACSVEIKHLRKRVRTLQQQIRRKDTKIAIMKSILGEYR